MEQIDTLLNGNKIIQDPKRFLFGIDAVLLSHFASLGTRKRDRLIDLGTGTGIIPLLMESACGASDFTGLEIQKESWEMAVKSVEVNKLESKIKIINGDIKAVDSLFAKHTFNVVTSNPPYMANSQGIANPLDAKAIARHEVLCSLEDVVAAVDYLLLPHGKFFMIHRPSRLQEIFLCLTNHKMQVKRIRLVYPFENKDANLVLIEARKNAESDLKVESPLIVRESSGSRKCEYTREVQEIYNFFSKDF